ncbi:hypothetical protein [Nostoc sp. PCC 7524]|uniref:hypothetical protein n=1 Tax=Nostoc sp. (strain ATCC 29411 / PCC 7524) TaxID=28072 RepID=UPI001181ABB0|nr:hypothetical protein [Nostoc sp. PCC 7524]
MKIYLYNSANLSDLPKIAATKTNKTIYRRYIVRLDIYKQRFCRVFIFCTDDSDDDFRVITNFVKDY